MSLSLIAGHYYTPPRFLESPFLRLSRPFMRFHLCHLTRASSRSPVSFIKPLGCACARARAYDRIRFIICIVFLCRYFTFTFYRVSPRGDSITRRKNSGRDSSAPMYLELGDVGNSSTR
jgi:hypothetical protein